MARRTVKTVCKLCGLCGCGMEVIVEDGRAVHVQGDKTHPESRGALCAKGRAALEMLYAPDRLKYPLKRLGQRGEGKWARISWDEALSLITEKFSQIKEDDGPEAVVFHKGSGHDLCAGDVRPYLHRLANLFGTPNLSGPFYVCNGPRTLNLFYTTGGIPAPEVENTNCMVLWGINPKETALPRYIKIQEALKRGAKLIVIDPRITHFASKADIHLQPRPGSDGALALGLLKVIIEDKLFDADFVTKRTVGFDELKSLLQEYSYEQLEKLTWVPEVEISKAAHLYAETESACVFLGNALDQHVNTSQAIRAIAVLIAITGNLDAPGGNVMYSPSSLAKNSVALHEKLSPEVHAKQLGHEYLLPRFEFTRLAHTPSVINAILDETPYPVKAMLVMASNPALTAPNSQRVQAAFEKLDFLAVADLFMTRTASFADIILPACTFLEDTYYATYEAGAYLKPTFPGLLMLRPQVVPSVEESKPDWRIIFDLAEKMGYGNDFPWQTIEEAIDYELHPIGITVKDLREHPEGIQIPAPSFLYQKFGNKGIFGKLMIRLLSTTVFRKYPRMYRKYTRMGFMTPSKKVEIFSQRLQEMGYDALPVYHEPSESPSGDPERTEAFPLVLTTGAKLNCYVHSQMRNIPSLKRHMPRNTAEIHPDTAGNYGIREGDTIVIESPRASLTCQAKVTDTIRFGVVQIYHGFEEANANLLTDSSVCDPITGSVPLRSSRCRIRKAQVQSDC